MQEDHPIDRLVVAVAGVASPSAVAAVRASAQELAGRRSWTLGSPEFFDQSENADDGSVGLVLSIYTALPPWGQELDREVDRAHLEEVKELMGEVARVSDRANISFTVDLGGEMIGTVQGGRMDNSLEVGLIGEWERVLGTAQS
jgi:hypothetical protein